jgi:hypothetical protein
VSLASFAVPEASTRPHGSLACPVADHETVAEFLTDALGQWETLWRELDGRRQALVSERQRLKRDFHERAEALDRQRAGLAAQRELVREEIRAAVAAAAAGVAESLKRQWHEMAGERAEGRHDQPRDGGSSASPGSETTP